MQVLDTYKLTIQGKPNATIIVHIVDKVLKCVSLLQKVFLFFSTMSVESSKLFLVSANRPSFNTAIPKLPDKQRIPQAYQNKNKMIFVFGRLNGIVALLSTTRKSIYIKLHLTYRQCSYITNICPQNCRAQTTSNVILIHKLDLLRQFQQDFSTLCGIMEQNCCSKNLKHVKSIKLI